MLTIPLQLRLLAPGVDAMRLHACLMQHYADVPSVQVMSMQEAKSWHTLIPRHLTGLTVCV